MSVLFFLKMESQFLFAMLHIANRILSFTALSLKVGVHDFDWGVIQRADTRNTVYSSFPSSFENR